MPWKDNVNAVLRRSIGYELRKPGPQKPAKRPERLLREPAFILSTVRSGSTLLRVLLDSHSQIHSPPELHLRDIRVRTKTKYADKSLHHIGLDVEQLRFLLWDRVLDRELQRSGKALLVNKTPSDVYIAEKILRCWPDARFIFLIRHPLSIARSRQSARPQDSDEHNWRKVLKYGEALEGARQAFPGLTVRYEDLAADAATVTKELCAFLGVEWEESMLDYGSYDHGRFSPGLGDWTENIRTGRVQAAKPLPAPEEVPPALRGLATAWGYLPAPVPSGS